jgi:hypothetical protein
MFTATAIATTTTTRTTTTTIIIITIVTTNNNNNNKKKKQIRALFSFSAMEKGKHMQSTAKYQLTLTLISKQNVLISSGT